MCNQILGPPNCFCRTRERKAFELVYFYTFLNILVRISYKSKFKILCAHLKCTLRSNCTLAHSIFCSCTPEISLKTAIFCSPDSRSRFEVLWQELGSLFKVSSFPKLLWPLRKSFFLKSGLTRRAILSSFPTATQKSKNANSGPSVIFGVKIDLFELVQFLEVVVCLANYILTINC